MTYRRKEVIGDCTLYLGDCLDVGVGLNHVDMVFTSPPYNCGKNYRTTNDSLPLHEFSNFLARSIFWRRARVWVVNVGQYIGSRDNRVLFRDILLESAGSRLIDEVIWDKGPANGAAWGNYPNSPRIRAQHESIYTFGDAKMETGNGLSWAEWSSLTTSIWRAAPSVNLQQHPAVMPVEIARRAVALWSDVNGVILDPFMGSGTTGVACVKLGRKFIGIEIDEDYFEIACGRIRDAYAQPDFFVEQPKAEPPKQEALL